MPRTYALPPGNCMSKTHALPPGNCTSKMSHLVSPKLIFLTLIFLHPNKQVGRLVPEVLPSNPHSHHRSGNHGKCFLYIRTRRVTIKNQYNINTNNKYDNIIYNSNLLLSRLQRCIATINRWTDYFNNHCYYWVSQKHRKIIDPNGLRK